ncbi:hypothetical protein MUY27_08950 [Mucilaginibacter sp. RS28]|uniref:Uncharacterized protein n=1 Tax=Mucilaginibacter straminoryzae TaxID=2932774 RepID=A0A9X2B9K5_9SPHI|nr:hypothetical protein [Mucilaginibacter straminoryzae]MCJ8209835.1 hypothetical protein [Mucilaginibacter straminoryzae]
MITNENQNNDHTKPGDGTIGENTDNSAIKKDNEPNVQDKPDEVRVPTVTPGNDSGDPGPSTDHPSSEGDAGSQDGDSSNKGKGPSGENL